VNDLTQDLLALIQKPSRRDDVVPLYGTAILYSSFATPPQATADWSVVNKAIIERWSLSALTYIKERAWKCAEGRARAEVAKQQQREREEITR
jgi:hypothetical protein